MNLHALSIPPRKQVHTERAERLDDIRSELHAILKGNIRLLTLEDLTRQMIAMADLLAQVDRDLEKLEAH